MAARDPARCTYVRVPRIVQRKISRRALFARDGWRCVYCGTTGGRLTLDHVIPRSQRRRVGVGERRHLVRAVQPPQGQPPPARGADGAAPPAAAAGARALHPARDAEDPAALGAVPRGAFGAAAAWLRPATRASLGGSRARPAAPAAAPTPTTSRGRGGRRGRRGGGGGASRTRSRPSRSRRRARPSGSSGSGSFHGALSAPGMRPGTRSIGFGSPRQRGASRASTTTSSSRRAASSSSSIVSSVRSRGSNVAGSTVSSPARERPVPARRGRSRRRRRGRSGAAATTAARRRPACRRRRRRRPGRSRPRRPRARSRRRREADAGPRRRRRRREVALDVEERRAGDVAGEVGARPQPGSSSAQRQSTNR